MFQQNKPILYNLKINHVYQSILVKHARAHIQLQNRATSSLKYSRDVLFNLYMCTKIGSHNNVPDADMMVLSVRGHYFCILLHILIYQYLEVDQHLSLLIW